MSPKESAENSKRLKILTTLATIATAAILTTNAVIPTQTSFLENNTVTTTTKADTLRAPTSISVTNTRVGETDIAWTASSSAYTTDYKILRSETAVGPWTQIGAVSGRSTVGYTDKTSGNTRFHYKVESIYNNWTAMGSTVFAPTIAGLTFTDKFLGTGNLDKRVTDNGASTWKVLSGSVAVGNFSGQGAQGSGFSATGTPAMAVVQTASQDGTVYLSNLGGAEGAVLRAKDSMNYVWVGGKREGTAGDGSFEVVIVKNGVRRVINDGWVAERPMGKTGVNANITLEGDVISARFDATRGVPESGYLHVAIRDSGLIMNYPEATNFGIGFTKKSVISGFSFDAKK